MTTSASMHKGDEPVEFYQAGSFWDDRSPISTFDLDVQIPKFKCPNCAQELITSYFSYPQLNVTELLSKQELRKMGPIIKQQSTSVDILAIIEKLRNKWNVPITAGTAFGPTRITVTKKATVDFHVLVGHIGLFCKRAAATKLTNAGIMLEYVETPAKGKFADDADFVEIVVPVAGEEQVPQNKTFCWSCFRYSPGGSFRPVLLRNTVPLDRLFFKTLQAGTIIFSGKFIELTRRLGLSGFVEGKTLLPVAAVI
jgi:hypothetical protein